MRIDSSGNVGIGVTSPTGVLHVVGRSKFQASGNDTAITLINQSGGDANLQVLGTSTSSIYRFNTYSTGDALRIENDGNVGIGSTSPAKKLSVKTDSAGAIVESLRLENNAAIAAGKGLQIGFGLSDSEGAGNRAYIESALLSSGSYMAFATNDGSTGTYERMRIGSDGGVGIGTTSTGTRSLSILQLAANNEAVLISSSSSDVSSNSALMQLQFQGDDSPDAGSKFINFADQSAVIGSIKAASASSVQYNTTSDARLKENITDAPNQLNVILNAQVRKFNWKSDGASSVGFIAQELINVIPEVIQEGGDDENLEPYQIDYGKLTPYLVKAIQEQQEQIEAMQLEIDNLKKS